MRGVRGGVSGQGVAWHGVSGRVVSAERGLYGVGDDERRRFAFAGDVHFDGQDAEKSPPSSGTRVRVLEQAVLHQLYGTPCWFWYASSSDSEKSVIVAALCVRAGVLLCCGNKKKKGVCFFFFFFFVISFF